MAYKARFQRSSLPEDTERQSASREMLLQPPTSSSSNFERFRDYLTEFARDRHPILGNLFISNAYEDLVEPTIMQLFRVETAREAFGADLDPGGVKADTYKRRMAKWQDSLEAPKI